MDGLAIESIIASNIEIIVDETNEVPKVVPLDIEHHGHNDEGTALLDTSGDIYGGAPDLI